MKSSSMIDILQKLRKIEQSVATFTQFWTSKIERTETSLVYRATQAIELLDQMAVNDVKKLFENLAGYKKFYDDYLRMERTWLDDSMEEIDTLFKDASMLAVVNWIDYYDDLSFMQHSVDKYSDAHQIFKEFKKAMGRYESLARYNASYSEQTKQVAGNRFFPSFAVAKRHTPDPCSYNETNQHDHEEILETLSTSRVNLSSTGSSSSVFHLTKTEFDKKINAFHIAWSSLMKSLSACLNEYPQYLSETAEWVTEQTALDLLE